MRSMLYRGLAVAALVAGAACSVDKVSAPVPEIEETTFASSLGVDLDAMTRTSTGLYVQDVVQGTGTAVTVGDSATVHYTLWLPDGRKVESSHDDGQPYTQPIGIGRLIRGWDEGIPGMKVGGTRRLIVPPALGYGSLGSAAIPPNSILIFDVELLDVK